MEKVFETLEIADIGTTNTSYPTMVETIFNRNFVNTFHHQNGTNQWYHTETYMILASIHKKSTLKKLLTSIPKI